MAITSLTLIGSGEEDTAHLLLGKFKWGHSFLSLNRELLKAYSQCENGSEIISVQNSWLSENSRIPKTPPCTKGHEEDRPDTNKGSDYDSEDGLPPLEENLNHLKLRESEESDEESDEASE